MHGNMYERAKTVFVRSNYDIFRLSVDLFLISMGGGILFARWLQAIPSRQTA
jgi:hypothetical protein